MAARATRLAAGLLTCLVLAGTLAAAGTVPVAGVALVVGIGFVVRLRTAPEPLIPLSILSDREARLAVIANAFGWGPIVGLHVFLPMYLQNVLGMAPAIAGLSVLMLAVTLNVSAGITGTILPQREHYKTIPAVGMAVAIGSVLVLAWRAESLSLWEFETVIAIIGIGFGAMPPLAATALQNNVSIHNYGSAVATMHDHQVVVGRQPDLKRLN